MLLQDRVHKVFFQLAAAFTCFFAILKSDSELSRVWIGSMNS